MRAIWNGVVIAEAEHTIRLEGNHYFPSDALDMRYFTESATTSICPWKGLARYYDVAVNGQVNPAAAWYYLTPSPLARKIKGHVAFWRGVRVEGEPGDTSDDGSVPGRAERGPVGRLLAWMRGQAVASYAALWAVTTGLGTLA